MELSSLRAKRVGGTPSLRLSGSNSTVSRCGYLWPVRELIHAGIGAQRVLADLGDRLILLLVIRPAIFRGDASQNLGGQRASPVAVRHHDGAAAAAQVAEHHALKSRVGPSMRERLLPLLLTQGKTEAVIARKFRQHLPLRRRFEHMP